MVFLACKRDALRPSPSFTSDFGCFRWSLSIECESWVLTGYLVEREKKLPSPPQPAPLSVGALEKASGKESLWVLSSMPTDVQECAVQSAQCWGAACKASPCPAQWLRSLHSVLKCSCFLASVLPENRLCVPCYLTKEGLHWSLLEKTQGSWVLISLTFKRAQCSKNLKPESRTHCELGSRV